MSLYEETRARLDDALAQLQICRSQRPLPDPAVLHRAQTMVEQQTQELRRAALVTLAARTTVRKEKLGHASGVEGGAASGVVSHRAPSTSKAKVTAATANSAAMATFPDIRLHPAASAAAAAVVVDADMRRGAARDGELFRRGDLLHKGAHGAAGVSTATFASAGRKAASPSPQSRTSAAAGRKAKASSSMPLPSRLATTTPSPRLKSSAVGEPRALTPTPPTAARPASSSSTAAVAPRAAASTSFPPLLISSGGAGDAEDSAASALVALESTLTFATDCLEKAAQSIEKGLHEEADAIFLKAIAADVERLRVVAATTVAMPAPTTRTTAATVTAAGGGETTARGRRRSPAGHAARQDTSRSEAARSPLPGVSDAEDGEHSWRNAFEEQGGGAAGGPGMNFIVEVGDTSGVRSDAEAHNFGIKGKHVPLRELPLALRAYYAVIQYDMLTLVSAFSRLLRHDAYADSGAAVLLHGMTYVERLVQCVCDVATAPPLRAGRDALRPQQASKPPITRVGNYPVKALLAVREAFNDHELRQLLGARAHFSEEDVQSVRIDYKVGEHGYHLVFTGTVYIYEMVQCLLRRAQALQQQCDHASGTGEQGSAAGLEAAAVAGASLSHTAANEAQWIDSMVSVLMTPHDESRGNDVDDDGDARSGDGSTAAASQGHNRREAETPLSVQLERVQIACTVALAQCIDICEGQPPLLFKLATTKYLGWRVKLYEALAQIYAQRGDYAEALTVVRRMSRKTKELVALEFYDQVPPPAVWQVTLETALQRGALEEMRYTWYVFIAGQHAFEAKCDASRRAAAAAAANVSSFASVGAAATASMAAQSSDAASAGGAGAESASHDRTRVGSRQSSSDARHRTGPNASVSGAAGGGSWPDGCPVVVSESGAIISADSLPRSGVALLGEIWSSLLRHPLPRPGSKNALGDDAAANAKNTDGASPVKAPSTTKSHRKSSLGRRASLMSSSSSPSGTAAPSQPSHEHHKKEALARQHAQNLRTCQRQFATQALAFLSSFLVTQNARVEATERDVVHLFDSGSTHASASQRGKAARAASPLGQRSPAGVTESTRQADDSAPPIVSFASLRRCAREALEIVFHCLSAQAVSLVDPALRGALLGSANHGTHLFPFPMSDTFTLEAENAALAESVGAQLALAMEKNKDEKRQREAEAAATSAGLGGHGGAGAGKGTKKGKPKNTVSGGKSSGTAAVGSGAGGGVHSEGTSPASGAAASGGDTNNGSGETLITSPVFVTSLSVSCLFPQLSRLAKWDHLACEAQLCAAAAAAESSGDDGSVSNGGVPRLQLPVGKAITPTEQSALSLDDESPLEAEVVLMLRLYTTLFSTPCHAVYVRTGAVLQYLLRACRTGLEKRRTSTTTTTTGNETTSAATPPTTHYLLEAAETTVRMFQHLHLSLLVSRFAAESCCVVEDVLLTGRADLRLVGLPRWLASRHESETTIWQAADTASRDAAVEATQHVVVGPSALLSGLLLSVKALVSAQAGYATAQQSLFHPVPSAALPVSGTTAGADASAAARVFRLCTPLLAPAELLRQLACAVAGGATTATWPSAPILASTVSTSYACANLFEQTLFVTADLILHEATTAIAARREDRQHRMQLGLTSTPFHDPTPAFLRAPAVTPLSPSPRQIEEDVDEEQEKTYFQIVIRTVEALASTGMVDPVRLGELTHSLADAALDDMEAVQRSTAQPEADDNTDERGAQLLMTLQQQKTNRGKSLRTAKGTASTLIADIDLPVYSRERRLQDLLDRARLAHAFVSIGTQLIAQRADALQQVLASPAPSGPADTHRLRLVDASTRAHLARLRHALEDTHTDLTRTATQLRWYVGLLRSQTDAYTQRQDDIRTLLARQLHSDVYGVVTAKETRILTALLEEEPALPQSAEAEEARLISAAYHDPLRSATVMLALATVVPKPLSAQRELLGQAIDVLLKLENSSPVRSASPGDRTAGGSGGSGGVGAPTGRVKGKAKKEGRAPPVVVKPLFSRLMVWGFAASVSAKLGATSLARTARKVLYRHYVLNAPEEDVNDDTSAAAGLPRLQRPVEEELHSYRLEPRLEALQSGSEGALATLCQALLDLSSMELTAVREEQPSANTTAARRETHHLRARDVQRVGLRCAYRLMFALQLLAMRHSGRSSKQTTSSTLIDTTDGASTGAAAAAAAAAKAAGRAAKPAGAASGKGKGDSSAMNASSSPSISGSSGAEDVPRVALLTVDPLTLRCAGELLNALFLLLEDNAPCVHVIPPLVALCQVILGIRSALVWCEVDVQLFAIRVLKGLRDTLNRLASQPQPPHASHGGGEGGAKTEDLTFLLHRTFVHAWNAIYAHPNVRQKRFLHAVSAESVYARYVLNTKDGVPPPPPSTSSSLAVSGNGVDASGHAHRGLHHHGVNRDDEDGATSINSAVTGEPNGEADGVFTFMGSQYAPVPETPFIHDRMPIEYLQLLEQLLLSQCTPEAVQDLLHPRPTPAPPRLPPLPQPASATSRYGDSAPAACTAGAANHTPSLSRSSLTGGKKSASGAVRRASGLRRPGRGLSRGSAASMTDQEAASAAALQALQQRQHEAAERENLKSQLRERLRIQSAYTIACQLGDAPLQGLPDILIQLAETLARDAALVSAAAPTVTVTATPASPSAPVPLTSGTILDVLERFAQDPLQTRLSIGVVQFYLCRGDIATARAVASAALSGAAEQWAGMKRFVASVQDGLKRWQVQHGFILSERPQYATDGDGSDADDADVEQDGGERAQPGGGAAGSRRTKEDSVKGKSKAKTGSNARKKNSIHGKHRGGAAVAMSDEAEKDNGPDPRFLDVPRVWSSAELLMLKQLTRSMTWLRRRRVFTWLTRRFFQFNGPAQAQLRVYTAALLRLEKDRGEVRQGTGGALVSLIAAINAGTATSAASTAERSAVPDRERFIAASPATSTGTAKGKRAQQQQQQADNEAAMAHRAREERDQLERLLSEHCLRAAKLFNQAFLPARSVRAVVFVVEHLRQNVCAELPDGFLLSQADPFMEADTASSGTARRRSDGLEDDQMTETTFSVWGEGGAQTGGGLGSAAASIDVARVLPASTVEKLRQLAPCLVELAKELLCAMATVALGYCDHRHDLELSQPSAIKTGPYVRLQNQIRFQGIIPSLLVCTSPAGQFEERRHTLLTQLAHTRHERQLTRRLQECAELEQTTRAVVVDTWKTELLTKLETNAQSLAETGREDLAALWLQLANTARTCGAAMDDFALLSPGARTRRNQQQVQLAQRGPARLFTLDTAAITTGAGGGGADASAISAEGEATGGTTGAAAGAGRRRAGPPTSTLVYFPFETPLLRRQLWNDISAVSAAPHGAEAASPPQGAAASQTVYTLRLGSDMPEELLVEYILYLVRAVQLTHQKEAVQLCLAANALTSGRYATTLLSLAMTVQAAIGMPSTAELLRAYRLARAEVPVGLGLLEVARRAWQRYHYTDTFARARQRLARSLLPSLKHFEDPSAAHPMTTTRTANALTAGMSPSLFLHDQDRSDDARGGSVGGGGVGMASLKVSLKVVLVQYEVALSALRKKRDFGLAGECLSEMAEIYLWHRSRTEAEKCWRDAVDSLLETPRSLQTWRTSPCDGSRLTLTRVLLAVSALGSLAMYAFRDQQRKAVEACVLAASLVDRLLTEAGISLMLPERAFDYAAHGITSLHNALRYLDLPLRQHQQIQLTVHKLLYVAHTLLEFDCPIHASMVASFAEYLASRFAKHWVMVVEARLVRARAAAKSGHFTAAFNALRSVCLGESFPEIAVALGPVADSLVTSHHFIQLSHVGSGGAAGTSDGKKGARQSSNANNSGGLGATVAGSTAGLAASGLVGPAASAPGPADGHAHLSVLETLAGLQYHNDEMPSSAANAEFVSWFVAACLPNFATLHAAASSSAAATTTTTSAASGSGVATAVPSCAQCLDVSMADLMGPLLAPRVVMAVAEVLVTLGSREGAYQWGEGVVGDVAAAIASATAGRPSSGRANGAGGARSGSRQRLSVAGGSTTSVIAAAPAASAAKAHGSTAAGGTSSGTPSGVIVESGPAVALQHATACTVALQVAEPLLDWLRYEHVRLSAVQVASGGGGPGDVSTASRGGLTRTLSTSSGFSGRETASPPLTAAGIGAEGDSQSAVQRLSQIIQQQRVEQAAMLRHHATYLRAVALAARGRLRQSVTLLEAHLVEFNEFALPNGAAADTEVAAVAETDVAAKGRGGPSSSPSSTARGSSVVRQQNSKNTRAGAAADVAFHLMGKGFTVSSVIGTPSFLLTVSHTHWCRVYALLTANCFGLRRFQAMETATRHALSLCDQCEDPYSSRLFLLYRCAALAQRGQLEDAAETARQLHRTTAALSFSPNGFVAAAVVSGAGTGQEQLAERVSALAVPCAHGVAAADVWDACTLLVQNWMQHALTQQAEQQRHLGPNAAAAIAEGSSSGGGGGGHGSKAPTEAFRRKRKTAKSQAQSDSEDVATSQSDRDEALQGGYASGGLALSRAVCALAANAFFQGVAPWVQQEKAMDGPGRSRRAGPHNSKHAMNTSSSVRHARWVVSPYGATVAWNSASLTQLHRAMNVYAASLLTPGAPRTEIDRSIGVLSQALQGVAPQYDARAHPTNSVMTKLLLARAWLHGMDWESLVYPASSSHTPARSPTTDMPGLMSAPSTAGKGRKASLRPLSASSTSAAAALTPEGSGTYRRGCGLLFYTPADAIAALPWPREATRTSALTAENGGSVDVNTAPPTRGLLQRAARLLFEAVHDSVSAAGHDYGVMEVALLELASIFARVGETAERAEWLMGKASRTTTAATNCSTTSPARPVETTPVTVVDDTSNSDSHVKSNAQSRAGAADQTRVEAARNLRQLAKACAPVAASCTILAMLLNAMQANVFDHTRAFSDYATDEANMVISLTTLEKVLPERVVVTVEAAARQLGTLSEDCSGGGGGGSGSSAAGAAGADTVVDSFYHASATDGAAGRARGGGDGTMSSRRAVSSTGVVGPTVTTAAAPSDGVPLSNLVHAFATLHREQGLTALMPAPEALDRESALVVLRALLQTKTAPPSCVYLCYDEATRRANAIALASGGITAAPQSSSAIGFSAGSGGGSAGTTRRVGGAANAATAAALQQQQETSDMWYAMLPPVLLSGSVGGYLTSAGPQLLGAPCINSVIAACLQTATGADPLRPRALTEGYESHAAKEWVTLLLSLSPWHDVTLAQAPPLSTLADRKRLLRGYPTCLQTAATGSDTTSQLSAGRGGRAGSAHSTDGFSARRRASSRQGAQWSAGRAGHARTTQGGTSSGAEAATAGDGRVRPLVMDALLAERIEALEAEEDATLSRESTSLPGGAATEPREVDEPEPTARRTWSCLSLELPLEAVRQLHEHARRALQLHAQLVECQRRLANVTAGRHATTTDDSASAAGVGVGFSPSTASLGAARRASLSRSGGTTPGAGSNGSPVTQNTVLVPSQPGPLASGSMQLQAALLDATSVLKGKLARQANAGGGTGVGFGGAGGASGSAGISGGGAAAGASAITPGTAMGNAARHGTRRGLSSQSAPSSEGTAMASGHGSLTCAQGGGMEEGVLDARVHDLAHAAEKQREAVLQGELAAVSDALDEVKSAFMMGFIEAVVRTYVTRALADEALLDACVQQLLPECAMTPALFTFFEKWFSAASQISVMGGGVCGAEARTSTASSFFDPSLHAWMKRVVVSVTQWRQENSQRA